MLMLLLYFANVEVAGLWQFGPFPPPTGWRNKIETGVLKPLCVGFSLEEESKEAPGVEIFFFIYFFPTAWILNSSGEMMGCMEASSKQQILVAAYPSTSVPACRALSFSLPSHRGR